MAHRWPFWKWHHWKSISFYPYTPVMCCWSLDLIIFKAKLKLKSRNQKNTIWLPRSHFESDIAENQQASAHTYKRHAHEISNWNTKANSSYAPERKPPTKSRNQKIQYGCQVAILKMMSQKNRQASTHIHRYCANEVWSWYSKPN